jgi:hypothetical protein
MKKQRLFSLVAAVVLMTAGSLCAQTNDRPVKANRKPTFLSISVREANTIPQVNTE